MKEKTLLNISLFTSDESGKIRVDTTRDPSDVSIIADMTKLILEREFDKDNQSNPAAIGIFTGVMEFLKENFSIENIKTLLDSFDNIPEKKEQEPRPSGYAFPFHVNNNGIKS